MNPSAKRRDRPGLDRRFYKAHGLGNDYLVFEAGDDWTAIRDAVEAVCHRNRGVGSDGIVCRLDGGDPHRLRMFNPDGSEFERSGNGLRVFAAFLASREEVDEEKAFRVEVGGDVVEMEVLAREPGGVYDVRIDMGRARVGPDAVDTDTQYLAEGGAIDHPRLGLLEVTPVSVGNPHCVYFTSRPGVEILREVGPFLASHRAFPQGVNVQVVRVAGADRLEVHVWERGAGQTSASGTSACAAAVAAVHRGLQEPGSITVEMPGGDLHVDVDEDDGVRLRGPVREICAGRLARGFCREVGGEG